MAIGSELPSRTPPQMENLAHLRLKSSLMPSSTTTLKLSSSPIALVPEEAAAIRALVE